MRIRGDSVLFPFSLGYRQQASLSLAKLISMGEPNFSESQLQQAVNTAYIRHVYEQSGQWIFVNVPSLIDEFDLGWDSGSYFPWYPQMPHHDHEGCNFLFSTNYLLSGQPKALKNGGTGIQNTFALKFRLTLKTIWE